MPTNPHVENEGRNPDSRESAYYVHPEEDALFDAYQMLYDAGYTHDELDPLAEHIQRMTVYDRDDLERYAEKHT